MKGLRVGTQFEHACPQCKQHFAVFSIGGILFASFAALFLSGIGWLVVVHPPGSAVGAEEENRWAGWVILAFAAVGWVVLGSRVVARVRHPAIRT